MKNFALKYTNQDKASLLTYDFIEVVSVMHSTKLLPGKDISNYGYYLIRLASRRGIKLKMMPKDIKANSKNSDIFNRRLVGKIYKALGCDKMASKAKYYKECKSKATYKIQEIFV